MRFAFGSRACVIEFDQVRKRRRPGDPEPRARAEMRTFDDLSPEMRLRIANSPFGAQIEVMLEDIVRGGAPPAVRDRLKSRGLYPCDVGNEGVLLELIDILEDTERERLRKELAC